MDRAGILYGTTSAGGSHNAGAVFALAPNGSGGWTERVIASFGASIVDGKVPTNGVLSIWPVTFMARLRKAGQPLLRVQFSSW